MVACYKTTWRQLELYKATLIITNMSYYMCKKGKGKVKLKLELKALGHSAHLYFISV